ncbi:hypothetical protein [Bradyrhizobium arachidis]|uniref:hypothetical protein n=1 Tax=Bradyrhizobium arachidis TaxID=858423 RepID=UPI002162CCF5|nr:hypothetical protein [Bradyrhizobium arachidis]
MCQQALQAIAAEEEDSIFAVIEHGQKLSADSVSAELDGPEFDEADEIRRKTDGSRSAFAADPFKATHDGEHRRSNLLRREPEGMAAV